MIISFPIPVLMFLENRKINCWYLQLFFFDAMFSHVFTNFFVGT